MSLTYRAITDLERVNTRVAVGGARWAALLLFAGLGLAAAQTSGGEAAQPVDKQTDTSLPMVTQATTRAELLELLGEVQTQLEALSMGAAPGAETNAQLLELRSQLEVLLLQAQLERLQRENADLQEQLSPGSAPGEDAEPAALEDQLAQLRARQNNMNTQMEVIAHQHAEILEYADVEPEGAQTHVVRPGDSLSELALTYYSDPARWPDILAANPTLANPDMLLSGTSLVIP